MTEDASFLSPAELIAGLDQRVAQIQARVKGRKRGRPVGSKTCNRYGANGTIVAG